MDASIDNDFASVLDFYDQFKRSKLLAADLTKIAKKYASKSGQLIVDLEKKYGFPIPKACKASNIIRICQVYAVPDSYLALLPAQFRNALLRSQPYDPEHDMRNALFDPEKVLASVRIISSCVSAAMCDNISKCKSFLKDFDGKMFVYDKDAAIAFQGSKAPKSDRSLHILETIALDSCKEATTEDAGDTSLSPFNLAHSFQREGARVRVIMRKRAG
jgi:hypothetical protein